MQQSHIFVTAIKYDILKVWRINDFNFFRVKKLLFEMQLISGIGMAL